jgi:hypothetical protein
MEVWGLPDLREMNLCLLGSWIRRYVMDRYQIWKLWIDFKYRTGNSNILTCSDLGASNFWKGVMWAARTTKMGYKWKAGMVLKLDFERIHG